MKDNKYPDLPLVKCMTRPAPRMNDALHIGRRNGWQEKESEHFIHSSLHHRGKVLANNHREWAHSQDGKCRNIVSIEQDLRASFRTGNSSSAAS